MRWIARARRRLMINEQGISITELVVAIGMLSFVMVMIYGTMASGSNAVNGTEQRLINIGEARLVMATASKDIRTATRLTADTVPFLTADSHEVRFYANLNPTTGPKLVRIYVDANTQLVEEIIDPDVTSIPPAYTYTQNQPRRRFVGQYVANSAAEPIFTYKDADGNVLGPLPLNQTKRNQVRSVAVSLSIRKSTNLSVAATTLVNEVRLPNLGYTAVVG